MQTVANKPFFDLAAQGRKNQRKAQKSVKVSKIPSRPEGQLEQS
jgi:hypothetical protein